MTPYRAGLRQLRAPLLAGLAAGIIATPVQLLGWWFDGSPPWQFLLRDTRLAAAILLGPGVLPPPLDLSLSILIAAGAVHFLLSGVFGLVQAPLARLPTPAALAAGTLAGALLFVVNMYGFTEIFPWFVASRDRATLVAHLAFGLSAAWLTRRWR